VMSLLSHVDDGAAESCWRWRCPGDVGSGVMLLAMVLLRRHRS
jgi:hypothetical protein